jgi:hypothetical protein
MGLVPMYDSIFVSTVPSDAVAVAGYVGGHWPDYDALVAAFPHASHLSIAPFAGLRAHCLDIETFDATPDEAPSWIHSNFIGEGKPVLYTSASRVDEVNGVMARAGFKRSDYLIWSAHYNYRSHVCAPNVCGWPWANGTQYSDKALNRNLDANLVDPLFFGPPPVDPHHYDWYPKSAVVFVRHGNRIKISEWDTVCEYDLRYAARPKPGTNSHDRIVNVLRPRIRFLRDRVWTVAHWHDAHSDGHPSWDVNHRGWRWQRLNDRLRGPVKL